MDRDRSIVLTIRVAFIYWILFLIPNGQNHRIQQFTLYSISEQTENYTQNICDLNLVSPIVRTNKLQSVCSQIGVWAFFTGKNFSTANTYGYHPASPGWTCNIRRIMADWQSPFKSIRHLGNLDLDIPSLSLYNKPFFAENELFLNGHQLSFSGTPFEIGSFGFTGQESWTLFSEPNYSGESVCLLCKGDEIGVAVGVTYTAKLTTFVSSIRRGCFGRQVMLPTGVLENRTFDEVAQSEVRSNINLTTLTLINLESNNSLEFSGSEVRLPCIEHYDHFQILKSSNWTVYSGSEFDGDSVCLIFPSLQTGQRQDESEMMSVTMMVVGSIQFGCSQNPAKENTTVIIAPTKLNQEPPLLSSIKNSNSSSSINGTGRDNGGISGMTFKVTTQTSREGRGRQLNINPVYVPGDDVLPKSTSIKPAITSTTTTTPMPTTTQPTVEELPTNESDSDNLDLTTEGTKEPVENLNEILEPKIIAKTHGEDDLDARPKPNKESATIDEGGDTKTAGMFFTGFVIILGILIATMIVTIGVFIYLRVTRSAEVDVES